MCSRRQAGNNTRGTSRSTETSQKVVSSLARWRDQAAKRHGWPELRTELRTEPRVVYADDEKAWITAEVHRDLNAGRPYDIARTNLGFQKLFGHRRKRTEVGIGSVMLRIRNEREQARAPSALMGGQLDEEEAEEDGEGEGEEEAALAALERENEAEDEAMARLEEERSSWEQDREEDGQQGGGGEGSGASLGDPSGE
jgi:hypothetical protein